MINSNEILRIGEKYNLLLVYLFGSKALEKDSILSDIDIAILLSKENDYNLREMKLDLIFDFSQIFHTNKLDLLILNEAPFALQYNVISEGKILYEKDKDLRIDYETKVIKLYLDFRKFETDYYDSMHEKILQGKE